MLFCSDFQIKKKTLVALLTDSNDWHFGEVLQQIIDVLVGLVIQLVLTNIKLKLFPVC